MWTVTLDPPIAGPGKFGTSPDATIFTGDPEGSVVIRQKVWVVSGKLWQEEVQAEVTEVLPPLVSKELKKRWSYFIRSLSCGTLPSSCSPRKTNGQGSSQAKYA